MMSKRIGFYICHCGTNIAGKVRTGEVVAFARGLRNVVAARDYKFMCSDPGQEMIQKDIRELRLNRVVVASCSPRLHEKTFQGACQRAGLNPYLFQMACVREHCSWVTEDPDEATDKAKKLAAAAISRVGYHQKLESREVKVHPDVLVVGGGIAGIQASLEVAKAGYHAYLVERTATIGGHMLQFDKTFPTLDCAACIGTPKMVSVGQNPNIKLMTYSEVVDVSGYVGNFKVKVRRKPRYVDIQKCTGCGECGTVTVNEAHPVRHINGELWTDRISIDESRCIHCGKCVGACVSENGETHGLTNIVKERFDALPGEQPISEPTILQKVMRMGLEERKEFWQGQFQKCIKCYGCVDVCPVQGESPAGLDLAKWVPVGQVPPSFPAYHLIRGYQVWDTCVGCGECEKTCPAHIPLKALQDIIRFLPPEEAFRMVPGLEPAAQKEIRSHVEKRRELSRRTTYAV
jgi:heterodisulfide reductase subunit A-like polyferredoxin